MFPRTNNLWYTLRRHISKVPRGYQLAKHNPQLFYTETDFDEQKSKESVLSIMMKNRNIRSHDDWRDVRKEIIEANNKFITGINIDSLMLGYCTGQKKYDLACDYMKFLEKENIKLNLAIIGKYLTVLLNMHQENVKPISEEEVISLYKNVRYTYNVLDTITSEIFIEVLSLTKYWKECLKLLKEIGLVIAPSSKAYSASVSAAFMNNEDEIAWNLLNEMIEKSRTPMINAYLGFFKRFEDHTEKDLRKIEKLYHFLMYCDIKIDVHAAKHIESIYKKYNQSGYVAKINRGLCKCCNKKLQKLKVDHDEFETFKKEFFKNVIIGKNVFCKTRPEELENFKKFLNQMGKVDVVVDGLNVAYSSGRKPPRVMSNLVTAVVRHFVTQGKKVLVLGRVHMRTWPNWTYVTRNSKVFLTEDISQDDPYLLYCALNSGLNTIIVSRDLMRSHKCLLKTSQQKSTFSRWYAQNQYHLLYVDDRGKPVFKLPLPYMWTAQNQGNTWHIPFETNPTGKDVISDDWLCLTIK